LSICLVEWSYLSFNQVPWRELVVELMAKGFSNVMGK